MPRQNQPQKPDLAFATLLRELRTKAGLSQEQLAFDSGHHRTSIGLMERGKINPTLRSVLTICAALEIPAGTFVGQIAEALGGKWLQPEKKVGRRSSL